MADPTSFNLANGQKAERRLLITAVNVATGGATKDWEILGAGIEDSAIELNPDVTTTTDILGITSTSVNKMEPKQTLEPYTVVGGSKLSFKLHEIIRNNRLSELAMFEVMQIHAYIGADGAYEAEVHLGCTITVTSYGGSANVDMPIEINYSNNKDLGTVDKYKSGETIVFTKATTVMATNVKL